MQSERVVEAHDVVSNVRLRLGVVGIVALPNPLPLEVQEEALHHSVDAPMSSRTCTIFQISQYQGVQLANDIALEAAVYLFLAQALPRAPGNVFAGSGITAHSNHGNSPQRIVGLPLAASIEPMSL